MHRHLTMRLDNEEILDGLLSRMDEIMRDLDETRAEVKKKVEEICVNM